MDRDQSFNATLRMFDNHVNLLEILHGKPAMATVSLFSGGFFTGRPQTHDHSSLLGMRPKNQGQSSNPLKLHLRHTPNGYKLVIKNTGEHENKLIGKRWLEVLGAQDSGTDDPMLFTLVDHQNNAITRQNISTQRIESSRLALYLSRRDRRKIESNIHPECSLKNMSISLWRED